METYTLNTPSGQDLEIVIVGNDAKIVVTDAGQAIEKRIELKDLDINFKTMELVVSYVFTQYVGEKLMTTAEGRWINATDFNYFLNLPDLDGNRIIKHCLNGILWKEYQYRCFDAAGDFHNYQPPVPGE